jgi:hypothetical protein
LKISFIDLLRSAFVKRDAKFRQKLSIFFVCLIISIIIWFTIKLSDEYDTVVEIPVTFTHLPKNKVLTSVSDSALQVEIVEKGSDLFRMLYVEQIQPVNISLRFLPIYPKNGVYHGMITPSLLINEIEREQNLLGKILSISPDTIYLTFEPVKSKKVPVKADFDLSFEKQFRQYGQVLFMPDCVNVKGPQSVIDNLDSVSLGRIKLDHLNQNYTGEKDFQSDSINRQLNFNPGKVTFNVPVEKFTEAETVVPVKLINSNSLKVKIFPDKIKVFYTVALKDYPKIEQGMIVAVADLSSIESMEEGKIKVDLESFPTYIRINKIEPEKVEFIIIR